MCNKCVINEYFGSFYRSSFLFSLNCMTSYSHMPLHIFIRLLSIHMCFTIMYRSLYGYFDPFYSGIIIQNYSSNLHMRYFVSTTKVKVTGQTLVKFFRISQARIRGEWQHNSKKKSKCCTNFHFQWILVSLWMGLKIQYILHSTGAHHMYVVTFCVLFVQERNRRLNVEVELTLQMATEAVQDMEQVSQGNCQLLSVHVLLR